MSMVSASAVLGRRTCAALAASSALLHGAMVGQSGALATVLMLGMVAGCLYCAYELWTSGSLRAWTSVAVMNLVMVGAHVSAPGHHHGGPALSGPGPSTLVTVATILALVEALIATVVLFARTRSSRSCSRVFSNP